MAVGDIVTINSGTQRFSSFAPQGPIFGIVLADGGDPLVATVQWENGKQTAGIDTTLLLKVFHADEDDPILTAKIGQFMQIRNYPAPDAIAPFFPPSINPKSPAAAGIVKRAGSLGPYDAEAPVVAAVVMSAYDGRVKMVVPARSTLVPDGPANLLEQPGRRLVGKQ